MEIPNELRGAFKILSRFRGGVWVPHLFDSVVQAWLSSITLFLEGVNNFFDFKLINSIYFNRWGRRLKLSR